MNYKGWEIKKDGDYYVARKGNKTEMDFDQKELKAKIDKKYPSESKDCTTRTKEFADSWNERNAHSKV